MQAKDVMTSPSVTIGPDVDIKDAITLLAERSISGLPVVDAHGALVGIVTEADLIGLEPIDPRLQMSPSPPPRHVPRTVAEVMAGRVVALPDDTDVALVARTMLRNGVKRVPIVSRGRVVGVVSRSDILKVLARPDGAIEAEVQATLDRDAGFLGPCRARVTSGTVGLVCGSMEPRRRSVAARIALTVPGVFEVEFEEWDQSLETRSPTGLPSPQESLEA